MTEGGSAERVARSAWEVCRRARRLSGLDVDLIVLGLRHGVELGAVRSANLAPRPGDMASVQAARLFAALQLKLARQTIGRATRRHLDLLLPDMPACWQSALRARLVGAKGAKRRG